MGRVGRRSEIAREQVARHLDAHGGYISWSGGKDSTVCVHLARASHPDVPVVWFDSGLEYPETRAHILDLAREWRLRLDIIEADPDALTVMRQSGRWDHRAPLDETANLSEAVLRRPIAEARRRYGDGLVIGLRAEESRKRALLLRGRGIELHLRSGVHFLAPVGQWSDLDIRAYHARHAIPMNAVYGRLAALGVPRRQQRVGLMMEGNDILLATGRAVWLRRGWPEQWERIAEALPRLRQFA